MAACAGTVFGYAGTVVTHLLHASQIGDAFQVTGYAVNRSAAALRAIVVHPLRHPGHGSNRSRDGHVVAGVAVESSGDGSRNVVGYHVLCARSALCDV